MATVTHRIATASTTNASSYASGSFTPAAGELLVAMVVASGNNDTAPRLSDTQNLGFAYIGKANKGSNADSIHLFVATGFAAATSMTVTFQSTSSTGAIIFVAGVSGMTRFGGNAVRQFIARSNQAAGATSITFGSACLTTNPTLVCLGNATSPAGLTPPSGWTENAAGDTGYSTPTTGGEYAYRDSGFTGTTVTWGSNSASAYGAIAVELDTTSPDSPYMWPNGDSSHPRILQRVQTSGGGAETLTAVKLHYPNFTGNQNTLALGATFNSGVTISSITDDIGNTWTKQVSVAGADIRSDIWTSVKASGGVSEVTVTFSATLPPDYQAQFTMLEIYGCGALDGTPTGTATAGVNTPQPGTITTSFNGSLLWNYAFQNYPYPASEAAAKGFSADNTWSLLGTDFQFKGADQYYVQPASGAINPKLYIADPNGRQFNSLIIGFKYTGEGTLPSAGIRIVNVVHVQPTSKIHLPSTGNLLVLSTTNNTLNYAVTGVNDTNGNTWTKVTTSQTYFPQIIYAGNATTGQNLKVSWTQANSSTFYIFYDIAGAHTSPYDTKAEHSGSGLANADINGAGIITPSTANGLLLALLEFGTGPPSGPATTGMIMDSLWGPGMTDSSGYDTGDGWAHIYNSGTGSYSFNWHIANNTNSAWDSLTVAFKGAPSGGVTVTLGAVEAKAATTGATALQGSLSLSPSASIAKAATVAPTVRLGSLSLTLASSAAKAASVNPSTTLGSISKTPVAVAAKAATVNPSVGLASMTVTLSARTAKAATVNPAATYGSLTLSPSAAAAKTSRVNPTVSASGGGLTVNLSASSSKTATAAPTVTLGTISVSLGARTAKAATVNPTVSAGGVFITLGSLAAKTATINPTARLGSLAITPTTRTAKAATVSPSVSLGNMTVTLAARTAKAAAVAPTVRYGSLSLTPTAATIKTSVVAPTIRFGSLSLTLTARTAKAATVNPSVSTSSGNSFVTPSAAIAKAASASPTVRLGSISIAGKIAAAKVASVSPSARLGSLSIAAGYARARTAVSATVIESQVQFLSLASLRIVYGVDAGNAIVKQAVTADDAEAGI